MLRPGWDLDGLEHDWLILAYCLQFVVFGIFQLIFGIFQNRGPITSKFEFGREAPRYRPQFYIDQTKRFFLRFLLFLLRRAWILKSQSDRRCGRFRLFEGFLDVHFQDWFYRWFLHFDVIFGLQIRLRHLKCFATAHSRYGCCENICICIEPRWALAILVRILLIRVPPRFRPWLYWVLGRFVDHGYFDGHIATCCHIFIHICTHRWTLLLVASGICFIHFYYKKKNSNL